MYLNDRFCYGKPRGKEIVLQTLERVRLEALYGELPPTIMQFWARVITNQPGY